MSLSSAWSSNNGKCINLTNKRVKLNANSTVKGLSQATAMLWFYGNSYPVGGSNRPIYLEFTGVGVTTRFGLYFNMDRTFYAGYRDGTTGDSGSPVAIATNWTIKLNRWYHLAMTFDADTDLFIFYVDGVEIGRNTSPKTPFTTTTSALDINLAHNANPNEQRYLDCKIDNFRLFNVFKTQEEIKEIMYSNSSEQHGLMTHLKFDKIINYSVIKDYSSNGYDATTNADASSIEASGSPNRNQFLTIKRLGNGLKFDGVDDFVNIPHNDIFYVTPASTFSISALFMFPSLKLNNSQNIISKVSVTYGYGWYLENDVVNGGLRFWLGGAGLKDAIRWNTVVLKPNILYHVVVTKNSGFGSANAYSLYINNVLITESTGNYSLSLNTNTQFDGNITIGRNGSASQTPFVYSNPIIHSIKLFNKALTVEEVNSLYKSDNRRMLTAASNLIDGWNFDESNGTVLKSITGNNNGTLENFSNTQLSADNQWVDDNQKPINKKTSLIGNGLRINPISTTQQQHIVVANKEELNFEWNVPMSLVWQGYIYYTEQDIVGFINKRVPDNTGYVLGAWYDTGKFKVIAGKSINGYKNATTTNLFDYGKMYHIVWTSYDASMSNYKIYVDGILQQSTTGTAIPVEGSTMKNSNPLRIGYHRNSQNGLYYTPETIYSSLIFNKVLTSEEVNTLYMNDNAIIPSSAQSSLVANWKFEDGSGTVVTDSSGNGNHGTLTNFTNTTFSATNQWVNKFGQPRRS